MKITGNQTISLQPRAKGKRFRLRVHYLRDGPPTKKELRRMLMMLKRVFKDARLERILGFGLAIEFAVDHLAATKRSKVKD